VLSEAMGRRELFELPAPSEVELQLLDRQLPLASRGGFGSALGKFTERLAADLKPLQLPLGAVSGGAASPHGGSRGGWSSGADGGSTASRGGSGGSGSGGSSGASLAQWLQLATAQLNAGGLDGED